MNSNHANECLFNAREIACCEEEWEEAYKACHDKSLDKIRDNQLSELLYWYVLTISKGRWPEAEPYIMKNSYPAFRYAFNLIKGRWPEAEPYIMKNSEYAYRYALEVIKGRWPEAEPYIMKNPEYAYRYDKYITQRQVI